MYGNERLHLYLGDQKLRNYAVKILQKRLKWFEIRCFKIQLMTCLQSSTVFCWYRLLPRPLGNRIRVCEAILLNPTRMKNDDSCNCAMNVRHKIWRFEQLAIDKSSLNL